MIEPLASGPPARQQTQRDPEIWAAATALEATFLAEMLKAARLGEPRDAFGGGAGEAQFAGLLVDEYARALAEGTATGLAESIYRSLVGAEIGA